MWPLSKEERAKRQEQKRLDVEKQCYRCKAFYTERDNEEERKCLQHSGPIIDLVRKRFEISPLPQIKIEELKYSNVN